MKLADRLPPVDERLVAGLRDFAPAETDGFNRPAEPSPKAAS